MKLREIAISIAEFGYIRSVMWFILGNIVAGVFIYYEYKREVKAEYIHTPSGFPTMKKTCDGNLVQVYES